MSCPLNTSHGLVLRGLLTLFFVGMAGLLAVAYIFGYVVPAGMMGVRQINFGPAQGFSREGLAPGYHWSIPFYSRMHFVPQKVQVIEFDREASIRREQLAFPAVKVQTLNGAEVDVDISIFRRFYAQPGESEGYRHGGPADLIRNVGTTKELWDNHLKRIAEDELRRALGELTTADFYNPDKREAAVVRARERMNQHLAEFGIRVDAVLLRRYLYGSEQIDNAIFQKNLQEQEERLNSASGKLAEARATLEQVSAEWDARIRTLEVEGDNRVQVIRSEADLYENQRRAEGDLEVSRSRAEIDRLRAGALAQSEGARNYIGRQMAPLLSSLKGGVVSGLDPYNLQAWMRKLGIEPR